MSQLEYELELELERSLPQRGRSEWELVTAGPEYTILGPTDDRIRVMNTRVEPFRHICKLEMTFRDPATGADQQYIGTGTIVAPAKVLTAAHCVFDRDHNMGFARAIRVGYSPQCAPSPSGLLKTRRHFNT